MRVRRAVIVGWCFHSINTTFSSSNSQLLCNINMLLSSILSFAWEIFEFISFSFCTHVFHFYFSCSDIQRALQNEIKMGKAALLLYEGREQLREVEAGGYKRRGEGRVNTPRQSHVWHLCSLRGGRTPMQSELQTRRREIREGRNKCKAVGLKEMRGSRISSCPHRTKTSVFVNGSWWAQPPGECNEKPGRLHWTAILFSSVPLSVSLSPLSPPAWTELGMIYGQGLRVSASDFGALCFRNMLLEWIWACCYFWLNPVCDVETPAAAAPLSAPSGYGPDWKTLHHPDAQLRLHGRVILQTPAWEPNRWNGKKKNKLFFPPNILCKVLFLAAVWMQQLHRAWNQSWFCMLISI